MKTTTTLLDADIAIKAMELCADHDGAEMVEVNGMVLVHYVGWGKSYAALVHKHFGSLGVATMQTSKKALRNPATLAAAMLAD